MSGECEPLAQRQVVACLKAEQRIGGRTQQAAVGNAAEHREPTAPPWNTHRVTCIVGDEQARQQLMVAAQPLQFKEERPSEWRLFSDRRSSWCARTLISLERATCMISVALS